MELQCRACTSTSAMEYIDFLSLLDSHVTYLDYFNQCTQLEAHPHDGFPNAFCTNCSHDLQVSYEFVQMAKQADVSFRQNQQVIKAEIQELEVDYVPVENDFPGEQTEQNVEETCVQEGDLQISIVQQLDTESDSSRKVEFCEEMVTEVHDDIVAEELLECQDDEMSEEAIQFYEDDIDALEEIEEIDNSDEHLQQILKDTQHDLREEISNMDSHEYYSDDQNDEEYLIEYDPNESPLPSGKREQIGTKWKCIECKRILRGDVSFEGHMNMHKDIRPYACSQCQCAFRCKVSLQRHANLRHDERSQMNVKRLCKFCRKRFKNPDDLRNHECEALTEDQDAQPVELKAVESEDGSVLCPHCKLEVNKDSFPKHMRTMHPNEYRKEPENSNPDDILVHSLSETDMYMCKFCDKDCANVYDLRNHMRQEHPERLGKDVSYSGEPLEECEKCGKRLLKRNMAKHMENHLKPEDRTSPNLICSYCSRNFKNIRALNQHEKMHKGEQPDVIYVCGECDRQYNTEHLLEQHRKQAHKERDNVCSICGNAFKLKNQLLNHMKLHLKRDIQCPQCDKKYARSFDLQVHMRTHTGEMPYACHLCDKRFAIKVRLTYHLQKHYGVKHRCKECGAEFNSRQKLKAHSFKHTGMPYICEKCNDHGFSNRDIFKRHLMRVHKTQMSDEELRAMFQRNTGKTTKIETVDDLGVAINISPRSTHNESNSMTFEVEEILSH